MVTTSRDPSGLKASTRHAAQVRALQPRERAAGLDLDQANDPARVDDDHQPAVGGEATESDRLRDLPHLAPGADFPEPEPWIPRHQPLPVGAEANRGAAIDGQLGHLRAISDAPDLGSAGRMTAGRQPLPVRADGDAAAVVQRADADRPLRGRDVSIVMVGHGHDPTRSVLGDPAVTRRQRELARRADAEFTAVCGRAESATAARPSSRW